MCVQYIPSFVLLPDFEGDTKIVVRLVPKFICPEVPVPVPMLTLPVCVLLVPLATQLVSPPPVPPPAGVAHWYKPLRMCAAFPSGVGVG